MPFSSGLETQCYACAICARHPARRVQQVQGRSPVGVENGREQYLILCDQVGTPLALANPDGSVVQYMRYDSFGNLIEVRGNVVPLPLGFAGGLFDPDTGLTRFVWRDYDADTGRFTALDPLGAKGGDKDWYGYCVDDPVNRVDMWGLFSFEERPLDGPAGTQVYYSNPILDGLNLELKHEQGFYDDGSGDNIGLFPKGLMEGTKHSRDEYTQRGPSYPDDIAREAQRILTRDGVGKYLRVGNNCQDFKGIMTRKMHEVGRYWRGSPLDPR
jgi:RHS repeat-associated protein